MQLYCALTGEPMEQQRPEFLILGNDGFVVLPYATASSKAAARARIYWELQREFPGVTFNIAEI